jgi:hypothetical protein
LATFIAVCQRHRFEVHEVPRAQARGWPTSIDFGTVRQRVEKLGLVLEKLANRDSKVRDESVFWKVVQEEVQALGSRVASGVKGQFDNFEKTRPG